jgi:hypothetical protein
VILLDCTLAALAALLLQTPAPASAGDPPRDVVVLKGGTILEGAIEAQDASGTWFRDRNGSLLLLSPRDVESATKGAAPAEPRFMRWRDGSTSDALQSAVATYSRPSEPGTVTLVGAVHVGDPAYFDALQAILDGHEVVLFEGVGGGASEKQLDDISFIFRLQVEMGKLLSLEFQKDGIDYGKPHWKNADMTWAEMQKELEKRDQSLVPMQGLLKMISPLLEGLLASQRTIWEKTGRKDEASAEMKRTLARYLAQGPELFERMGIGQAGKRDDVIVSLRNEAAFEILDATLEGGAKSVAVFYGAAHLPDMHRRLLERGFERRVHYWVDAWRVPARKAPK